MRLDRITYGFLLLWFFNQADGQLSPGPLSRAHEHLEGLNQCTQCHDIGQKIPNEKCLACHQEIQSLISQNRGFHAFRETAVQDCIDCHSDHHGLKFDMVRFDTESFDHNQTGYKLEGQHNKIDCNACHQAENIFDDEISEREGTYLGLQHECISCHADFHQNTLSQNCASCHDFNAFRPATKFDHNDSMFALTGMHQNVECKLCHPIEIRSGREFQVFKGLSFGDCVSCHDDPHNALPGRCNQCHTDESFNSFLGRGRFDHNQTAFELKGKHRQVDCFTCHDNKIQASQIFQDLVSIQENECVRCHTDVHEGKFGSDCVRCHNENSFLELNAGMDFDHSQTDFPLEGLHQSVECNSCHEVSFLDPIAHDECKSCHEDYHKNEFASQDGITPDCKECHSLYYDFTYTSFGPEEHEQTDFPLEGSHLATPCFECHLSEEDWKFRDIAHDCVSCHTDIHKGFISDSFYPNQDCTICHSTDIWSLVSFDHSITDWPLENKHLEVDCRTCHFEEVDTGFIQKFVELENQCFVCHENIHGDQFDIDGITDCIRCHNTQGWNTEFFDHSNTAFPLEGRHAELDCDACHNQKKDNITIFKIEKFECIDCHS